MTLMATIKVTYWHYTTCLLALTVVKIKTQELEVLLLLLLRRKYLCMYDTLLMGYSL